MRTVIRNGHLVDPARGIDSQGDVLIEDGKIRAVGQVGDLDAATFDAAGQIVAPGFFDLHVHLREPGAEESETIRTGGEAAVAGGFTAVAAMPNTKPPVDSAATAQFVIAEGRRNSPARVFPIGAVTKGQQGETLAEIGEMVEATRDIAAGRFDHEVHPTSQGEIGQLAESFNTMLKSLRQMKEDLEDWARTLEEKVAARTEELVAMQERVAQSERLASLGMLAAGVAHEINNPLGGILSLTALTLEDMAGDDANRENLTEVVKQSERCREIVRGLLEFSRQSEVGTERVDVNQVLLNTLALIRKQALFFNIKLVEDFDPELPAVTADESQLEQVFMNILMNAVQAMEEKGTLTIVTRQSGSFVEVLISDTGRGIPSDEVDRIFDPFYSTKESGEGAGLGLSIAYGIISKHRGNISVESKVGKGSTFTIRLPATPEFAGQVRV